MDQASTGFSVPGTQPPQQFPPQQSPSAGAAVSQHSNPEDGPVEPKVLYVDSIPGGETISQTLIAISVVVVLAGLIGGIAYVSFSGTLNSKLAERKENELLYQEAGQTDILGLDNKLPEIQIGKNPNAGASKQLALAQQQAVQRMGQGNPEMQMKIDPPPPSTKQATKGPEKTSTPSPSPSPTPVPDNMYVSKDGTFSLEHDKWARSGSKTEGNTEMEILKSSDGKYTLTIGITKKKFSTVQEYLDTDPRGRKPKNGTTTITLGGESGLKANTFELVSDGATYKTIAGYVLSKDKESVISIELDSTDLDVNNKDNETVFDKIKSSFKFIDKND